jgi:hypothetical protein
MTPDEFFTIDFLSEPVKVFRRPGRAPATGPFDSAGILCYKGERGVVALIFF